MNAVKLPRSKDPKDQDKRSPTLGEETICNSFKPRQQEGLICSTADLSTFNGEMNDF